MIEEKIDQIISPYKELIGREFQAYKNHVHRVSILTLEIKKDVQADDLLKVAIAVVHHDIGIWTEKTFDYLEPSIKAAQVYLKTNQLDAWSEEVGLIIEMHHKRSVYKGKYADNVDSFRRADLIDVTKGRRGFGISSALVKSNFEKYPMLGFRGLVIKRFLKNLIVNPFNPLPVMKK